MPSNIGVISLAAAACALLLTANRHHAALSRDLFCPGGVAISTAAEGREALRLGRHPHAI